MRFSLFGLLSCLAALGVVSALPTGYLPRSVPSEDAMNMCGDNVSCFVVASRRCDVLMSMTLG